LSTFLVQAVAPQQARDVKVALRAISSIRAQVAWAPRVLWGALVWDAPVLASGQVSAFNPVLGLALQESVFVLVPELAPQVLVYVPGSELAHRVLV
jgi:hypothetical protein